jgi:hypothetical protein
MPFGDDLRSIIDEARAEAQRAQNEPPVACPNDGEPLEHGPSGELHCPFDGWTWQG